MDVQQVLEVSLLSKPFSYWSSLHVIDPTSCSYPPLQSINVQIDENALHEILNEVDLNKNGQVEIDEFMQVRELKCFI